MPLSSTSPGMDRHLLRDHVYLRLRDAIVDGTLAPGEQLKDIELAGWLGVSRGPVRDALLRLSHGGLVLARPGRATVVAPLDARETRDARDVVAAMHQVAVRESVHLLTDADLAAMRDAGARFAAAVAAGDVEAALLADDDLHAVPVRAAGNRALEAVLDQLTPVVRRVERARFGSLDAHGSITRHGELIRLCAAGDAEAAAAVAFDTWHSLPSTGA